MAKSSDQVEVYLETGKKRTFAGALDWPGWCRSGRDEAAVLQALLDYAPRYARALEAEKVPFHLPAGVSAFTIVERLEGGTSTDFGAPAEIPAADAQPVDDAELRRLQTLLRACWQALDSAAQAAAGKELRKGPRGGGREVEEILRHVRDAEAAYLSRLGGKLPQSGAGDEREEARRLILDTLAAAARGELPTQGPRGGARWPPRYFVRRAAWHVLDHAWEIEDRIE